MVGMAGMNRPLAAAIAPAVEPAPPKPPTLIAVEENGVVKFKEAPPAPMDLGDVATVAPAGNGTGRTDAPTGGGAHGGGGGGASTVPVLVKPEAPSPAVMLTQLQQFITVTPQVRVQNKAAADLLLSKGLVIESAGFLVISKKGIVYLADFGML